MNLQDISVTSLALCLLLLLIPVLLSHFLKLGLIRTLLFSALRMGVQLFLMGFYLTWLFKLNSPLINICWMIIMVTAASLTVVKSTELNRQLFFKPVFLSLLISVAFMLLYFNLIILQLPSPFEVKYFVVIGGMLMGNSLRGSIIGLSGFYNDLKQNEPRYLYSLAAGATCFEAAFPAIRKGLSSALRPTIATMATMGLVFLPGMMTGQILGGSPPLTAIKYQIAIMIAIFVLASITVTLAILLSMKRGFNGFGVLKKEIFFKRIS